MVRPSQIQNCVANQHHQIVVFADVSAGQRLVIRLYDYAVTHPLPELFLCGPELFSIAANDERRFLLLDLFLLVFFCRHIQGFTSFDFIIRVMAFGFRFPSLWEGLGEGAKHSARRALSPTLSQKAST